MFLPLSWHDHHRVLRLCTVVTFPRQGFAVDATVLRGLDLDPEEQQQLLSHVLQMPPDDVNATTLCARLRAGSRQLPELPAAVETYVRDHHLYGA